MRHKGSLYFVVISVLIQPIIFTHDLNAVVFYYSSYLGGSSIESGKGIAVDSAGNAYITGQTVSSDFPTFGSYQSTLKSSFIDAFITKFNPSGALIASTFFGGTDNEYGKSIALDDASNAYITGETASTDLPVLSPYQGTHAGGLYDIFVSKFAPSLSQLSYSTYLGGSSGIDSSTGIGSDISQYCYVTGYTDSTDFPTQNPYQGTFGGMTDAFISKLDTSGSALVYSTYLGGSGADMAWDLSLDSYEAPHVTGQTGSSDFPISGPYQVTFNGGNYDAFVTSLTAGGLFLFYSTYLGGSSDDSGLGIDVHSDTAYVTGETYSTNFPTYGPYQGTENSLDAFVTRLTYLGDQLAYSTYLGGSNEDSGQGISVDSIGNAYITGYTASSSDFPLLYAPQGTHGGALTDAFATKINAVGSAILYSTYAGGIDGDWGREVDNDPSGNPIFVGETNSANFPTVSPYQGTYASFGDAFVFKLSNEFFTAGIYRSSTRQFFLRNINSSGPTDVSYTFGGSGDLPLPGDWNVDSTVSAGAYRPSTRVFFLRNLNSSGSANFSFSFGSSGDLPLSGDWDGNGSDSIGVYRPTSRQFFLRNGLSSGSADYSLTFGSTGDVPVVGDWDGNGTDTIGVRRPTTGQFFLRNSNTGGAADYSFVFGSTADTPIAGDWNGDRITTVGVRRSSNSFFYLRNSNTGGSSDKSFSYGSGSDKPLAGNWDGK